MSLPRRDGLTQRFQVRKTVQFEASELKSYIMPRVRKNQTTVVSALLVRTNFGRLLRSVEDQHGSLVIAKRGSPKAVLLSIRDYVRLAAPEPEVLRLIGQESRRKGTDQLTAKQIEQVIKSARADKSKRG